MSYRFVFIIFTVMFVFSACSNDDAPARKELQKSTVLDSQMKALEKAKGVEKLLQESADRQHDAIKNQN